MNVVTQKKVIETRPFTDWIDGLTDQVGKAAILERIERLKKGLLGTSKPLTNTAGVFELVIDTGPGYRVYYALAGNIIVLLLLGGAKSTQKADIRKAAKMLAEMVAQRGAAKKKREEDEKRVAKATEKDSCGKTKPKRK